MSRTFWTDRQVALLVRHYPNMRTSDLVKIVGRNEKSIYTKAHAMSLNKTAEYLASPAACRLRRGDEVGKAHRFPKGNAAWNKGMKGLDIGGKETRFKKGQKPHTWRPIGYERITVDGYTERKVSDTGITKHDFVALHVLAWQEHNGKIPHGHIVVFKDGNKQNVAIENLECITRAENMRRNSYHNNYPKEVAQLIQLRGVLQRKINAREKA